MKVFRIRGILFFLILSLAMAVSSGYAADQFKQIIVATGSPFELGLVDTLAKAFQQETGCTVRCIKTPTGPGLELGRNGLAHVTMGHNREATARFFKDGYAAKRSDLMYNLTVIVGPLNDPAGIGGMKDLKQAHKKIFEAKARYLSRGDMGGMNIIEKKFWKELALNPEGQPWYEVSNKFMLDSLMDAAIKGQYHMLDSSTWALHKAKVKNLKVLVEGPKNEYEMCLVNPEKNPNLRYNQEYAQRFYDFCLSEKGQRIIATFGTKEYGEPVYFIFKK